VRERDRERKRENGGKSPPFWGMTKGRPDQMHKRERRKGKGSEETEDYDTEWGKSGGQSAERE
jgi:hypothetical protein